MQETAGVEAEDEGSAATTHPERQPAGRKAGHSKCRAVGGVEGISVEEAVAVDWGAACVGVAVGEGAEPRRAADMHPSDVADRAGTPPKRLTAAAAAVEAAPVRTDTRTSQRG